MPVVGQQANRIDAAQILLGIEQFAGHPAPGRAQVHDMNGTARLDDAREVRILAVQHDGIAGIGLLPNVGAGEDVVQAQRDRVLPGTFGQQQTLAGPLPRLAELDREIGDWHGTAIHQAQGACRDRFAVRVSADDEKRVLRRENPAAGRQVGEHPQKPAGQRLHHLQTIARDQAHGRGTQDDVLRQRLDETVGIRDLQAALSHRRSEFLPC